jgi:hypothetical protein
VCIHTYIRTLLSSTALCKFLQHFSHSVIPIGRSGRCSMNPPGTCSQQLSITAIILICIHCIRRVPLMIAHPLSPFHGQHYPQPVELVDVYPTVIDLLGLPTLPLSHRLYKGYRTIAPQGKSLAAVVLGLPAYKKHFPTRWATPEISEKESLSFKAVDARQHSRENSTGEAMPLLTHDFAVSQVLKCSPPYIAEKGRRSNIKNNAQVCAVLRITIFHSKILMYVCMYVGM